MLHIKDIHPTGLDPEIDTRNPERVISPIVSPKSENTTQDISSGEGSLISLQKQYPIKVQKKTGKHFDALEKKSAFSRIFTMRDIYIGPKTQFSPLSSLSYYASKLLGYFKSFHPGVLVIFFIGFLVVYGLGSKYIIENRVNAGYGKLLSITHENKSLEDIQKSINNARFDLLIADTLFTPFELFGGEKIDSVGHVISGGRYISRGLDDSLALYTHTNKYVDAKDIKNIYFTQLLLNVSPNIESIHKSMESALSHYEAISWLPNASLWQQKNIGQESIENVLGYSKSLNDAFPDFLNILGHDERKRYLIVFQNADEIRPTGGFMGSMGLLEVFKGKVQLFQQKDVYAIEWDLKSAEYERLAAPKGISQLTDTFGLRDANYYANLQDSSNAIKFFTDNAGIDLDGIVYINQNTLLRLLDETGPIYFDPLEREITSDNFSELMSLAVEAKTFKQGTLGTPKQVLFDFMQVFIEKLTSEGNYFNYGQVALHDLESRDIMFHSFDDQHNQLLSEFSVNGEIDYSQSLDYLYPVYTSLSGNKSDRYMQYKYIVDVTSQVNSCNYNVSFQIRGMHAMTQSRQNDIQSFISEYNLDSPNLFEIQGAATNKQFMRVIIPNNIVISPKQGTEVVDYGVRKGLEYFQDTQLSEISIYENNYIIENPQCENYSTTIYKQPGILEYSVDLSIDGENYDYNNLQEDFYFENRK